MFDLSKLQGLLQEAGKVGGALPWARGESGGLPSGSAIEPYDVGKSFSQGGIGGGLSAMGDNLKNHLATQGGADFKSLMSANPMGGGGAPPPPAGAPPPPAMQPNPGALEALNPQSPFTKPAGPGARPGQGQITGMEAARMRGGPIFGR